MEFTYFQFLEFLLLFIALPMIFIGFSVVGWIVASDMREDTYLTRQDKRTKGGL